jgi:hypothetical protein
VRFVLAFLLSATVAIQTASSQRAQDIVERLMPEGLPDRLVLPAPAEKSATARQLRQAQAAAHGARAQRVAFLLPTLGSDYERNRDYLLWALEGCRFEEIKRSCDDLTPENLVDLYKRGHAEILGPLLRIGLNSYNAAGSEFVGDFAATVVAKTPAEFLDAIRTFPAATQGKICYYAGLADGGGMAPSDLKLARRRLSEGNDPIARNCLREVNRANHQ